MHRLEEMFRNVSVLVAGDLMLDEYIVGSVSRISPEAPVPIVDVISQHSVLGGAGNVAANIASLGATVSLVGLAGFDPAGKKVRELLRQSGIDSNALVDGGDRSTISKTRVVVGQQQVVRIDCENRSPVDSSLLNQALNITTQLLFSKQSLVLSDYAKGLLTTEFCSSVIAAATACGVSVIVDPKSKDFRKYRGCTLITPNISEAALAANIVIDSESALYDAGEMLLTILPGTDVLVTRGADGMTLFRAGHAPMTVPTVARKVFDVVGAGDTVIATLAVACGAGIPMHIAMHVANIAAGIVVAKPGTATPSMSEILDHELLEVALSLNT